MVWCGVDFTTTQRVQIPRLGALVSVQYGGAVTMEPSTLKYWVKMGYGLTYMYKYGLRLTNLTVVGLVTHCPNPVSMSLWRSAPSRIRCRALGTRLKGGGGGARDVVRFAPTIWCRTFCSV